MDQETIKALLGALVRHGLTSAAGILVAHGYLQSSATEQFVAAGLMLAGIAWSWWQKQGQAQVMAELKKLNAPKEPNIIAAAPKTTIAILIGTGLLLAMMGGQAQAQKAPRLPDLGSIARQNDANPLGGRPAASGEKLPSPDDLWQKITTASLDDLNYAAALATSANTNGSKVRLQCINALIDINKQARGDNLPKNADGTPMAKPDPSLVTHMEMTAEVIDALSPTGPLFTACSGAAGLLRMQVLQVINAIVTGAAGAAVAGPLVGLP